MKLKHIKKVKIPLLDNHTMPFRMTYYNIKIFCSPVFFFMEIKPNLATQNVIKILKRRLFKGFHIENFKILKRKIKTCNRNPICCNTVLGRL